MSWGHGAEALVIIQGLAAAHHVGKTFLNKAVSDDVDSSGEGSGDSS